MSTKKQGIITNRHLQSVLEDVPQLFKNFPTDSYREFLECGTLQKFLEGQVIISEKENMTNRGWLVTEGEISIFFNNVLIERIKAGDFLGETFIFKKKRNPVAVMAETDVSMISFHREPILKYFRDRSDRLLKIFIINMLQYQNDQLLRVHEKYTRLYKESVGKL